MFAVYACVLLTNRCLLIFTTLLWAEATQQLQEEVSVIEGQVSRLTGLVQQQDALNAVLKQRLQATGEAESRAKVPAVIWLSHCITFHPDSASMRPMHAAVTILPDTPHCYLSSDAAS